MLDYETIASRLAHDALALCRHITFYSEMAREQPVDPARFDEIAQKAHQIAAKIRVARRFAGLEAHRAEPQLFDGAKLCQRLLGQNRLELKSHVIGIIGEGKFWADPFILSVAMQCLIDNVIAHGASGGRTRILVSDGSITVANPSARPAKQDDLEPFQSSEDGRDGLGLTLAVRAMALLGGEVLLAEEADEYAITLKVPPEPRDLPPTD